MKDLTLELTDKCYNQCMHCSSSCKSNTKNNFLQMDNLGMILDAAKVLNFERIILSGGEPLLHPDFLNIVRHIKTLGFQIKLYTSGIIDTEQYPHLSRMLEDIDIVSVSQYATEKHIHNFICDEACRLATPREDFASYSKSQWFIQTLEHFNIPYEINTVLMPSNSHEIIPLYRKFKKRCISFNVLRLVLQGNALENFPNKSSILTTSVVKEIITYLQDRDDVKLGESFGIDTLMPFKCDVGRSKMCITSDGYVIPCETFKDRRKEFKHYEDYSKIREICNEFIYWGQNYQYECRKRLK